MLSQLFFRKINDSIILLDVCGHLANSCQMFKWMLLHRKQPVGKINIKISKMTAIMFIMMVSFLFVGLFHNLHVLFIDKLCTSFWQSIHRDCELQFLPFRKWMISTDVLHFHRCVSRIQRNQPKI